MGFVERILDLIFERGLCFFLEGIGCDTTIKRLIRVFGFVPFIFFIFISSILLFFGAVMASPFIYIFTGKNIFSLL